MENSSYVEQGTYKIRHKSLGPLITGGLAPCSAISFTINDNDIFMTHIDANTDVIKIAKDIQKLYPSKLQISNVKIWYGTGFGQHRSEITQKLIQDRGVKYKKQQKHEMRFKAVLMRFNEL